MSYRDPRLFHDIRTTKDFFLSQTDGTPSLASSSCKHQEGSEDHRIGALAEFFPCVPVKQQFIELANSYLEPINQCIALAVKIDTRPGDEEETEEITHSKAVAAALEALCQQENGLWGLLEASVFGCFFCEKTASFVDTATAHIRKHISNQSSTTVSVGIAEYPLADFSKTSILENACKALDHASFFGPGSTVIFDDVSLNISGDNLFQQGNIHAAINEFQTALFLNDNNTNVKNSLGVCYALLGRYDDAIEAFRQTTAANPEEFMAFYNLGLVYMMNDAYGDALDYFLKAGQLQKDIFEITVQTGRMHLMLGEPLKAIPFLKQATELNPDSALGFRLLGDCYTQIGNPSEALTTYKQAVKLHPNDAGALSALGALYEAANKNIEIAVLYCEKSVELAPSMGLFHERLGKLYLKQHRLKEAAKSFQYAETLGRNVQNFMAEIQQQEKAG